MTRRHQTHQPRARRCARQELGRQERNITPVDLAANEIYDILRKRLFTSLPDQAVIADIAEAFGRKLEEAAKSKTADRGAEAIADEIAATYPFHPRLKNVVALFKENEQFKQTRGLSSSSPACCSPCGSEANDVFLIGPQHFDLSIPAVRDKLTEISGHARRHRQGPLGRARIAPRAAHRPRSGQRCQGPRSARCCSPPACPPR